MAIVGVAFAVWAGVNIYTHTVEVPAEVVGGPAVAGTPSLDPWALTNEPPPWSSDYTPDPATAAPVGVVYPEQPSVGDKIGTLSIPALKTTLPIVEGTGEDELGRGVGHFEQSVLPGANDNCVLSGHRDTVFGDLGDLVVGDRFVVRTAAGRFTYVIRDIRIVDKDDRTVIVPTDHAVLTVTTCYPFRYIGSAPDRYVLSADLLTH